MSFAYHAQELTLGDYLHEVEASYLVARITGLDNVEVVPHANITALEGEGGSLTGVRWQDGVSKVRRPVHHVFLFIGAEPNSIWLAQTGRRSISAKLSDLS